MKRLASVLLLFFFAQIALCQSVTGSLVGTVTDTSGGVIAGVKITVINQGTNALSTAVSDRAGDYRVTNLPAGTYKINFTSTGFRSVDIDRVELLLNQVVRNDVRLAPGEVQQVVEITAAAPVVQTETSSVASVIDSHALVSLPTNGRTLDTFVLTAPGNTGEDSGSNPKIAGSQHWGGTTFTVDGVGYNDLGNGGGAYSYQTSLTTQPSLDTIQEVKVESNNASAEFSSSVAISMVTKGGTNQFHGTAFAFNRNTLFAANDYFANASAIPRKPYNRNELGLTIGGPIYRNHTFFFFSFEQWIQRTSNTGTFSVPTAAQRAGCFTTAIKDPMNGGTLFPYNTASCPSGYQIPASRLEPRTQAVLAFVPLPIKAGSTSNLVQSLPSRINVRRYDARIDHNFNPSNLVTVVAGWSQGANPYSVNLGSPAQYNNYSNAGYTTQSLALTYTRILTPSMTNEFRVSYFDHASVRQGQNLTFDPSTILSGLYPHTVGGLPTFSISGLTAIADRGGSAPNPEITEAIGDTYSWNRGRHQFKAGADIAYNRVMTNPSVAASTLGFFYFGAGRYSGSPLANALLGYPNDAVRSTMTPSNDIGLNRYGFFAQDTWHIFPRLTLNLGLRYELQTEPTEHYGSWTNFDFDKGINVVRSVGGKLPVTTNQTLLNLYPYATSESVGWGSNVLLSDRKNFAPRVGFAFRPFNDDSTVVRGGFGIFYNMPPIYQGIYQLGISNPPFRLTQEYDSNSTTPTVTVANPFNVSPTITANPTLYAMDRQMHNTYAEEWNLTVEQRLPKEVGLRISYLGNKAVHAPFVNYDMNMPQVQGPGSTLQVLRPYQPYADIYALRFIGASFTNQMQVELTKRYNKGAYFSTSLNWTKGIDNVPETGSPQNPYNPGGDRGNADGVRHLTYFFTGGYDLPFGPGKQFANGGGIVSHVLEGWTVSAIAQVLSGAPFSVSFDVNSQYPGWYATRANVVPGIPPYAANRSIKGWLNPSAFATPPVFTFGNSERNGYFGPMQRGVDIDISKSARITERVRFQFRADAFNLTNTANFTNPLSDVSISSTMGTITSTNVAIPARTLQLGGKVIF